MSYLGPKECGYQVGILNLSCLPKLTVASVLRFEIIYGPTLDVASTIEYLPGPGIAAFLKSSASVATRG